MNVKALIFPFAALLTFAACSSSSSDPGSSGVGGGTADDGRRIPLGKADLAGSCKASSGTLLCGGKSQKKCWCDSACVQYGDCCADFATTCGGGGAESCESTADCPQGQFCSSPGGCGTPGSCKPIPTDVVCTAVVQAYCGCDGVTQHSTSGCIYDRYAHVGECQSGTTSCGGFANLPCAAGQICVDDSTDSCDPQNGGADCPGVCVTKKSCGGFAGLPCPSGNVCLDDPADNCDPQNGGADCPGVCVPDGSGCPDVMCTLFCSHGFEKGPDGCSICACAEPAKNSCELSCGSPSADKSCYCDKACEKYGDCCSDYKQFCDVREPASGACIKNSNNPCSSDLDCTSGGCGGELCFNPAVSSGISTCECTAPTSVQGCGCVAGKCTWYN